MIFQMGQCPIALREPNPMDILLHGSRKFAIRYSVPPMIVEKQEHSFGPVRQLRSCVVFYTELF